MAGGDSGGKLEGGLNLATRTNSSAGAQIFDISTNTFVKVGSLNTARESAAAVALPNGQALIVGGETCGPKAYGSTAGFQCNALNTAELYNERTKVFTFAGSGSGGVMIAARNGPSAILIEGSGTALDGQVLIVGGSTGSSFLSAATTPPIGSPPGQVALNSAELYDPVHDTFTVTGSIPGCALGVASCATGLPAVCAGPSTAIASAVESGTTVTVTMTTANPTGLLVGSNVAVSGVSVAGYNGAFAVTAIPSRTMFQYAATPGLNVGAGGTAAADTAECGIVDQGAALIPSDSGKVLLAGGDLVEFLGESSNLSFIFDPATQTFTETAGSLITPRELVALLPMDPSVVTGALSGQVVAFGGVEANSSACTTRGDIVATTLNSAEVFDPGTETWSMPSSTMGVKRAATATLIETGSLTGEVILPGGTDLEAGTLPSTCVSATSLMRKAQSETDLYEPDTGIGGAFVSTGILNQPREGPGTQAVLVSGRYVPDVLMAGVACTSPTPSLQSAVIGGEQAAIICGATNATDDYSELYSQSGGTWSAGPSFATGFTPSNGAASVVLP